MPLLEKLLDAIEEGLETVERAVVEDGLVVASEVEPIALSALDRLAKAVKDSAADEVGRELTGGLLRTDDLADGLALGLKCSAGEEFHRLAVGHPLDVHLAVEDRVDDRAEVKLQLVKTQREVA